MSRAIDVMHLGRDRVICAYELDGVVVDPGPAASVGALADLEPRALLLTHIHLDHAGAAGVLVRRFPALKVYVHERGAPHLVDPSKLLASAERLYGEDIERLFGEVAPVPEQNVEPVADGARVEGFSVAYTPGHASHHVCYLDEATGDAYVGDVAGVRIPPCELVIAPTPPPDIDLEAWGEALDTVEGWRPEALCLTHFGRVARPAEQIERMRERLSVSATRARESGRDGFLAGLEEELRAEADSETAARYRQAAPPDQLWLGLERYWRRRAEEGRRAEGEAAAA
ncbi:MAG: MBL fold metallo-hydrolase [Actinomycetota bacterium]|nr:MBL fold metallo-hydrolase [Actinomycetota bacterium]